MATNLHFPLFVQKKLQTSPLSLVSFLIFCYCTVRKWPIGFSVSLVFGKRCFNLNFTASKNKSYSEASGKIYAVNLSQSARKLVYLHHKRIKMTKKQTNKPQGSPTYEKTCIYVPACVPCFRQFAPERFSFQPGNERIGVVRQKPYRQQTTMYTFTTLIQNKSIKIGKAVTRMAFFLLTVLLQLELTWTRTFPNSSR